MSPPQDSPISSPSFLTRAAFVLTPSHDLTLDRASAILEKLTLRADFSVTKTSTGILFCFSDLEDFQVVYRRGFHRATGGRLYRKIIIPCRPQRVFTLLAFEIPNELPEDDIRSSLYRYGSVIEVTRLPACLSAMAISERPGCGSSPVRISLGSLDEYNALLKHGLDFYGATYFPTEPWTTGGGLSADGREMNVVFDATGFTKIPAPIYRTVKARNS